MEASVSLNKFISDTGYCSRREADRLILEGRVLLNGVPAKPGNRWQKGDEVEVDGSLVTIKQKEKPVYLAFNKPVGITTTTEEQVRGNIISFIGYSKRIFPIGRLDKDSEGLIFLTNDGDMVNKMLRAGNAHEKEYLVRVHKPIEPGFAEKMSAGIPLAEGRTLPCKVRVVGRQQFSIVLVQGWNRQIRRMCEYLGYTVNGLQRTRIMQVRLDKLAVGKWRYLSDAELHQVKEALKTSVGEAPAGKKKTATAAGKPIASGPKKPAVPPAQKTAASGARKPAASSGRKNVNAAAKKTDAPAAPKKSGSYKAFRDRGRQRG